MLVRLVAVPLLAVLLGICTALSFLAVGGPLALAGPYVLERMWPLIYPLEALVVGGAMVAFGSLMRPYLGVPSLIAIVLAAWVGELVILGSGLLADELVGFSAIYYWVLATGGPLQPIAAIVGAFVGLRLPSRSSRPVSSYRAADAGE